MEILDRPELKRTGKSRTLQDVLENGYDFEFGQYLSRIFQLIKPTWVHLVGNSALVILFFIIALLFVFYLVSPDLEDLLLADPENPEASAQMARKMMSEIVMGYGIAGFFGMLVLVPFRAGIHVFLKQGIRTGVYSFSDFFIPFKTKWVKLIGLIIIIVFVSYIWVIVPYFLMINELSAMMESAAYDPTSTSPFRMLGYAGLALLGYIVMIYFLVSYSLSIPLILFKTDNIWQALEGSRKIVSHKGYYWFIFLGYYAVMYILMLVGMLACGIGLLLTMNAFVLGIFTIYEGIFGIDEPESELVSN